MAEVRWDLITRGSRKNHTDEIRRTTLLGAEEEKSEIELPRAGGMRGRYNKLINEGQSIYVCKGH